jgi:hypothetical protein
MENSSANRFFHSSPFRRQAAGFVEPPSPVSAPQPKMAAVGIPGLARRNRRSRRNPGVMLEAGQVLNRGVVVLANRFPVDGGPNGF